MNGKCYIVTYDDVIFPVVREAEYAEANCTVPDGKVMIRDGITRFISENSVFADRASALTECRARTAKRIEQLTQHLESLAKEG